MDLCRNRGKKQVDALCHVDSYSFKAWCRRLASAATGGNPAGAEKARALSSTGGPPKIVMMTTTTYHFEIVMMTSITRAHFEYCIQILLLLLFLQTRLLGVACSSTHPVWLLNCDAWQFLEFGIGWWFVFPCNSTAVVYSIHACIFKGCATLAPPSISSLPASGSAWTSGS